MLSGMTVRVDGNVTDIKSEQLMQRSSPMLVTPSGSVRDDKEPHPENTQEPMVLRLRGMETVFNFEQPANA